jgi:hypothetical protein
MINESCPDPQPHMYPALITKAALSLLVGLSSFLMQVTTQKEKRIIKRR